ncbi:hypothetical protein FRC06_002846 [Ceratobasidium sp. 370]|nr:hypothetical protein FRC06_002846 [Ceratobasidium sp. 370]
MSEPGIFTGFKLREDPNAPAPRHAARTAAGSDKVHKAARRLKIRKIQTDGYRKNIGMIKQAIENINFSMEDFQRDRERNRIRLTGGGPYGGLKPQTFTRQEGPRLLVDRNGVILVTYLPDYIGSGLQRLLLLSLGELVKVCKPRKDRKSGDRRANTACGGQTKEEEDVGDLQGIENQGGEDDSSEDEDWVEESDDAVSMSGSEDSDTSSEWSDDTIDAVLQAGEEINALEEEETLDVLQRERLPPSSFYWAGGWYATGMENKRRMVMSSQLRAVLAPGSRAATLRHFAASRELNDRIRHLTHIIHNGLCTGLKGLRARMRRQPGVVGEAVAKAWSSVFPCAAVGFNRTTRVHRDSKGFRNGLDVIGVLGRFTGGNLKFQDINVTLEWGSGCLAAFDGYDLAHEVEPWEGHSRVTLISFCRSSSWRGLKLPLSVLAPKLEDLKANLEKSVRDKEEAAEAIRERQRALSQAKAQKPKKVKRWKMGGGGRPQHKASDRSHRV